MPKRSERTATVVGFNDQQSEPPDTIKGLLQLLQKGGIRRITLSSFSVYRSNVLSDRGSQFTVYTGDGVNTFDKGAVVVKCAKLRVGVEPLSEGDSRRERANSLYREVQVLTNPRLRSHPNILALLWYDFVDMGNNTYIPALVMERAPFGALSNLLHASPYNERLDELARVNLSKDITSGLLALHRAGIIHGDVKSDNVLIFGGSQDDAYMPKIADFGSVIVVGQDDDDEKPWRYYGTPSTNAPEVENQTISKLDRVGLRKCDNYSLGLLLVEVTTGHLDSSLEAKAPAVLQRSRAIVSELGLSQRCTALVTSALGHLLQYEPRLRCSDLAVIHHIFNPGNIDDLSFSTIDLSPDTKKRGTEFARFRDGQDVAVALESVLGLSDYLDIDLDIELESERDTQKVVYDRLLTDSKSPDEVVAGKALFQLSIAAACGFGVPYSSEAALNYAVASARTGYLPAQASAVAFRISAGRSDTLNKDVQIDWLFESTAWGSYVASACLKQMDTQEYNNARAEFHKAGGFNQFFYGKEPPLYINSSEFIHSLSPEHDLMALAESAAIYGDVALLRELIANHGLDPNLTNSWGESLILLCCKSGHLNVLEILASSGATANSSSRNESPLHWLIAYDDSDVFEAARILAQAGGSLDATSDMSWNHPSIDLPGRFPLGSPLHYAIYFDSPIHVQAIASHFIVPLNWTGSSTLSPLEYGIARRKVKSSEAIIAAGALEDPSENVNVLAEIGQTLAPDIWLAMAVTGESRESLLDRCLDLVLSKRPELLDAPVEGGFTPLMSAVQYHDRPTVKALIDRGCNVNAETPPEYDGRTALNLITENKMQYPPDDIIELLHVAGANFSHRSNPGGKEVLHFAARDDCLGVAEKILDLGANINAKTTGFGQTPLHLAADYGSLAVAELLLSRGADAEAVHTKGTINSFDWNQLTPVAMAAVRCRKSMVTLLLHHGASALARPLSGHTVLHLAATEPDTAMLKLLLKIPRLVRQEVLDYRALNGVTALHLCAGNIGRTEHLSLLLEAGADPNVITNRGHSVLDVAQWLKKRLESWLDQFKTAFSHGQLEEAMMLLVSSSAMWQPITIRGIDFSLLISHGDDCALIPLRSIYRYHNITEENDVEGQGDCSAYQDQKSPSARSHDTADADEGQGGNALNWSMEHEDDCNIIDLQGELDLLDRAIQLLLDKGARSASKDVLHGALFDMHV